MDRSEAQACLRVLLCLASADDEADDDKARLLRMVAEDAYAPAPAPAMLERTDCSLDEDLAQIKSGAAKDVTFRAALSLVEIDGRCTAKEHAILQRIHRAFGVSHPLELEEAQAGAQAEEARGRMRAATDDFLHAVNEASKSGDLPQDEYEKLVSMLEDRKRAALAQAIAHARLTQVP